MLTVYVYLCLPENQAPVQCPQRSVIMLFTYHTIRKGMKFSLSLDQTSTLIKVKASSQRCDTYVQYNKLFERAL